MAADQSIVLITGGKHVVVLRYVECYANHLTIANGGIGFELAVQLVADSSKHVILCSRSTEKGEKALKEVQALGKPGGVELLQLDVDDEESIEHAAKIVSEKHGR